MTIFRFSTIAAAAFVLALTACSQTDDLTPPPALEPQFGTSGYDEVTDVAYDKALTLYAVGALERRGSYNSGAYVQRQNAFVRRYARNGNLVWQDYFDIEPAYANTDPYQGYVPKLTAHAVTVDNGGNAVVAWSADYSAYVYDVNNGYDYRVVASFNYLTKYSPSGTKLWRVYTDHPLTDLALDSNANIYATSGVFGYTSDPALYKYTSGGSLAWARSQSASPSGVTVSGSNSVYIVREDGAVAKYSISGTYLWLKTGQLDGYNRGDYGGNEPYKITAGLADELFITTTYPTDSYETCDAGLIVDSYTMRVYKLSSTGVRQWFRNIADGTFMEGESCWSSDNFYALSGLGVDTDTRGNVYIAGYQDNDKYSHQDGFIAKYSRSGTRAWKKAFVTFQDDAATSVATYDGSEVFIGGVTEGNLAHRQLGGGGDAVLRKVNSNGDRVWTR